MSRKSEWTAKELWDWLKDCCIQGNWILKWAAFNRLENLTFSACESFQEFGCMAQDVLADFIDLELTMVEMITLKVLNGLGGSFPRFMAVVNENART